MKIAIHASSAAKRNVNVNPRHFSKGRWIYACNFELSNHILKAQDFNPGLLKSKRLFDSLRSRPLAHRKTFYVIRAMHHCNTIFRISLVLPCSSMM
jgi:hypothetical protein